MLSEIEADIWDPSLDEALGGAGSCWRIIPVNGARNGRGQAVMGRGMAKQAQTKYPELRTWLGVRIKNAGSRVVLNRKHQLILFPVKKTWSDDADIDIIRRSCRELLDIVAEGGLGLGPDGEFAVLMPHVGCGNGRLQWIDVWPALLEELEPILDKLLVVYTEQFEGR